MYVKESNPLGMVQKMTTLTPKQLIELKRVSDVIPSPCGNYLVVAVGRLNENGTKYITMSMTYGGDWSRYSMITNSFEKFLHHKFYHRLCGRSLTYWTNSGNIELFRAHIFSYIKHRPKINDPSGGAHPLM